MKRSLPFRAWYYFRMGYATYLAFILAATNTMVTTYYLAISNLEGLKVIFPSFTSWILFIVLTVGPLTMFLGWLHLKRSSAFRSEQDVYYEANPYNFRLPPGYWREAVIPTMLEILRLNLKMINKESMTEAEVNSLKDLQKKLQVLIDGGYVGQPKRMYTSE